VHRAAGFALALALVAPMACSESGTVVPPWHVANGFLRDVQGRAVILRGANVSGKNKDAPYFDFHTAPDFARMRTDWGMNAVRFVAVWAAIEPQQGVFDDAYLDGVAQRIAWAQAANLYVIVDMHQDVYGEGFASGGGDGAPKWTCDASHYADFVPTSSSWFFNDFNADVVACYDGFWGTDALEADYTEAWRRLAARLASYDNVVGCDVMNEPYWGTNPITDFEADQLAPLYERVVAAVRAEAPGWVAFLEPSAARNLGGMTRLPVPSFSNYVYSPHSYDQNAESGDGFDPSHGPAIIQNIAALQQEAQGLGAALWIGEYGGTNDESGIVDYMSATYDGVGAVAASSTYWDYTMGGYGMLNTDGTEAQPLVDTLVRPYPERVAGSPISWAFDATTSTFTFSFHPDPSVTAPTVVSVPPRVYASGYTVECGGCQSTVAAGSLTITTQPPGDPAVVTLHP
jgi:endoglycosylceramidase